MSVEPEIPAGTRTVFTLKLVPGKEAEFLGWLGRLDAAREAFPGFLSTEVVKHVPGTQVDWVVLVSFDTPEHLQAWLDSDVCQQLLHESAPFVAESAQEGVFALEEPHRRGVTVVQHHQVHPGSERAFQKWQEGILQVAARQPGYQEAHLFPPRPRYQPDWVVVYGFDTEEHLQRWLESSERREWYRRGEPLFGQAQRKKLAGGFAAWFATGEESGAVALPSAWKQAMTVLLVIYPTVMLIYRFFMPHLLAVFPQPVAIFGANMLSVAFLQYAGMRAANRALGFWLHPRPASQPGASLLGAALVLASYTALMLFFTAARL